MEKEKELVVLASDDIAAKKITVTGWVSRNGRFYGDNEQLARWDGSTHNKCDCGNIMTKGWTKCDWCRHKSSVKRYNSLEFKEWDGIAPVYSEAYDKYFFDGEDEIAEWIEDQKPENEINPSNLMLLMCLPNHARDVDYDTWNDDLAEDQELPKVLCDKIEEFNKFLETLPPLSWSPSKIRTEYKP